MGVKLVNLTKVSANDPHNGCAPVIIKAMVFVVMLVILIRLDE